MPRRRYKSFRKGKCHPRSCSEMNAATFPHRHSRLRTPDANGPRLYQHILQIINLHKSAKSIPLLRKHHLIITPFYVRKTLHLLRSSRKGTPWNEASKTSRCYQEQGNRSYQHFAMRKASDIPILSIRDRCIPR